MNVITILSQLLGRELEEEERRCLCCLSPGGMAKLNADIIRGICPEETIASFCRVFRSRMELRNRILKDLPLDVQAIVEPKWQWGAAELMYLCNSRNTNGLLNPESGDLIRDIDLKDCGAAHQLEQLFQQVRLCEESNGHGSIVTCCPFVPTACPSDLTSLHFAISRAHRTTFYHSPTVSWFQESNDEDLLNPITVSIHAAASLLSSGTVDDSFASAKCRKRDGMATPQRWKVQFENTTPLPQPVSRASQALAKGWIIFGNSDGLPESSTTANEGSQPRFVSEPLFNDFSRFDPAARNETPLVPVDRPLADEKLDPANEHQIAFSPVSCPPVLPFLLGRVKSQMGKKLTGAFTRLLVLLRNDENDKK